MNKRMREILGLIEAATKAIKAFRDDKKFDEATTKLAEVSELQKEFEIEKSLYEVEKAGVPDGLPNEKSKTETGFEIISKMLKKQDLTDTEKALVTGGSSGENLLIPEDVDLAIRELRKQYKSAKNLVTVIPTDSIAGGFNFEKGAPAGLVSLTDGGDIDATGDPSFERKAFAIKLFGKLIAISNVLKGAEKSGLMAYINKWFVKNAIITENTSIFTTLKAGKSVKSIAGWKELKTSINKELDPSALIGAKIVTNQTGFDILDSEVDAQDRPILQANPANATQKLFQGLLIEVFSDAELPNLSGNAPIFYGSLDAGCYFIEKIGLEFAVSDQYLFGKNQTALRVIEGFDTIQADASAYIYGHLSPKAVV